MPKKQAIAFFEEISKKQQLAQEVEKVLEGKDSDEAKVKELLSLAKKYNFNFSAEDEKSTQGVLKTKLSPEEMLEVSGGKLNLKSSLMAAAMLLGLRASGATMSNMEVSAMKKRLADFSSSSDSGKRPKIDPPNSTQNDFNEFISRLPNRDPQGQPTTSGTPQQPTPQPAEATGAENLTQNETPPSNGQGAAQSNSVQPRIMAASSRRQMTPSEEWYAPRPPHEEKKVFSFVEHDKEAVKRFGGINGCSGQFLGTVRGLAGNGYLPNAAWPAVPQFEQPGDGTQTCRYCNAESTTRQSGGDPFCKNQKCIFPWIFRPAFTKRQPSQRPVNAHSYARCALLPALILDSRYINIWQRSRRSLAIETPAEARAVWQLIVGTIINLLRK